jgi:site-specific DNA-methyltransferase (adenine-specific)
MAMFPPSIPHVFIRWLTEPGEIVYDPFSGRGTTVLEACNSNRVGIGSDANPLAWLLTAAKAEVPSQVALYQRLKELRNDRNSHDGSDEPPEIKAVFHPNVLGQLLWLRETLSTKSRVDRHLIAVLLGILHANARADGTPRGLTVSMPNTFSMAPGYVMRYINEHDLEPPDVDVLEKLEARVKYLREEQSALCPGCAWMQDATKRIRIPRKAGHPKLIFTSPPYLGVMKYGKLNWLRLWFLNHAPKQVDDGLFASGSLERYTQFMTKSIRRFREVLREDGYLCLVIGDVRRPNGDVNLAQAVADRCLAGTDLRLLSIIEDRLPTLHKVSRIWKETRGRATKTDRILVLGAPGAKKLPKAPNIDWSTPDLAEAALCLK